VTDDSPIRCIVPASELDEGSVRPLFGPETRIVKREVVTEIGRVYDRLAAARALAEECVAQAHEQADSIRRTAHEEGRAAGWREVLQQVAAAEIDRRDARVAAERDMLDLAFALAERLVGRALDRDATLFGDLVADKLEQVRGAPRVTVRVHPDQLDDLRGDPRWKSRIDGVPVQFEADPRLTRGDCIIETERGRVDARLQTQLDEMRRALQAPGERDE
jgi:flagellar biosynthesis/type III secretory pathway protein FliH